MLYNCIMSLPAYKSITFLKRAASTRTEPKQCGTTAASTPPCEPEDLYRATCLSALYAPNANVKRCMGKSSIRISEGGVQQYE